MKSIKPGRGPSLMNGVVGIFMILFGIIWIVYSVESGIEFVLFGVVWTGIVIAQTIYSFKNATGRNRYSQYDITDESEEMDPFNERFGNPHRYNEQNDMFESRFCPYCGAPAAMDFEYCNNCGRKLPR